MFRINASFFLIVELSVAFLFYFCLMAIFAMEDDVADGAEKVFQVGAERGF